MSLFIQRTLDDGRVEVRDKADPAFSVTLTREQAAEVVASGDKAMAFELDSAASNPEPAPDAAEQQRDRSNVAGEGKVEPS